MFAPSETQMQPFLTMALAQAPSISFCVAQGRAMSILIPWSLMASQMFFPSTHMAEYLSAYSLIRPRLTFFSFST